MILREKKVIRFEIAVNDSLVVGVSQRFASLSEIKERPLEGQRVVRAAAAEFEQIAARHIFQDQIVKRHSAQVGGGAMPPTQDHIRMAHGVQSDRLVLK